MARDKTKMSNHGLPADRRTDSWGAGDGQTAPHESVSLKGSGYDKEWPSAPGKKLPDEGKISTSKANGG